MGLWFGTGEFAKVILVFLAVFYPIVLCVHQGIRAIDERFLEVARVHSLSKEQTFTKVLFPAVLPYVYSGLSQAIAFAGSRRLGARCCSAPGTGWAP